MGRVPNQHSPAQRSIPKLVQPLDQWAIPTGALTGLLALVVALAALRRFRRR